jgi:adenylate kinase family enzyme
MTEGNMHVIALSGKIGTGKTTVAEMLLKYLPYKRIAFADVLKQETAKKFRFPVELCYSETGKNTEVPMPDGRLLTVRNLLQWYGTDVKRAQDPDYWVKRMEMTLYKPAYRLSGVIIDDVRFPNEAHLVERLGGSLFRIQPYPGYVQKSDHVSETVLDDFIFPIVFTPDYGKNHLQAVADEIFSRMRALDASIRKTRLPA